MHGGAVVEVRDSDSTYVASQDPVFFILTDRTEPARTDTGLPVQFGREPDEFKFEFKPRSTIGSDRFDQFPVVEKNRISVEFDVFSNLN
jgi:hypothetical protein